MPEHEAGRPADPYRASRVRKGILHFLVGKGLTSIAGIGTMLVLVRAMPLVDFATYSVLFGLVELISAVSGFGILHVLGRYVPEVHSNHLSSATHKLIATLTGLRLLSLLAILGVLYATSSLSAPLIGLAGWTWALQAYLLVALVRIASVMLFSVLESLLHQGIAQFTASFVTISRFATFLVLMALGTIDLKTVIMVELATDVIGLVLMIRGLRRVMPDRHGDGAGWVGGNARRMTRFGLQGYLQHLLLVPFGGNADRLMVGSQLATGQVAMFGFAQNLADLMERYMPAQMFVGLIRPVLTARFASGGGFAQIQRVCNMLLKVNVFLIGGAAVGVYAGGRPLLDALTGGKDFPGLLPLVMIMLGMLCLYSWRHILDLVTHTVERNGPLIAAHLVMNLSVLPGFLLMSRFGVYALPVSHLAGTALGCIVLLFGLARQGYRYHHDPAGLSRVGAALCAGFVVGHFAHAWTHWIAAIAAAGFAYMACAWLFGAVSSEERRMIGELLSRRGKGDATDHDAGADDGTATPDDAAPAPADMTLQRHADDHPDTGAGPADASRSRRDDTDRRTPARTA